MSYGVQRYSKVGWKSKIGTSMGSSLSGNYGGRVTVEGCQSRVIAVSHMFGRQDRSPRQGWKGSRVWTDSYTGEKTEIRFSSAIMRDDRWGFVDLEHDGRDREGGRQSYRVRLWPTEQPLGNGLRWWFVCPLSGRLVHKLYLPLGAARFAGRLAYKLAYKSTRETPRERAYRRAWKRRQAMGGRSGIPLGSPLDKPPRQHWCTWERDQAKLAADERVCDRFLILSAVRLGVKVSPDALKEFLRWHYNWGC